MSDSIPTPVPPVVDELDATRLRLWKVLTEGFGGISLVDAEGKVLYDGVGSKHLLGHAEGSDIGTSVFARLHPEDQEPARLVFRQISAAPGVTSSKIVFRFLHTDGAYRWIEGTITNLADPDIRAASVPLARCHRLEGK